MIAYICRSCSDKSEIGRGKVPRKMGFCIVCEEYHALYPIDPAPLAVLVETSGDISKLWVCFGSTPERKC